MKLLLAALVIAIAFLSGACDPGMTIYQTHSATTESGSGDARVAVYVNTTHPLIGETWYAPDDVSVTNLSEKPIIITDVELTANGTTYKSTHPRATGNYPLTIAPAKTENLPVWFDLKADVARTFEKAAELRVHFRKGGEDSVVRAHIVGGPLGTNAP